MTCSTLLHFFVKVGENPIGKFLIESHMHVLTAQGVRAISWVSHVFSSKRGKRKITLTHTPNYWENMCLYMSTHLVNNGISTGLKKEIVHAFLQCFFWEFHHKNNEIFLNKPLKPHVYSQYFWTVLISTAIQLIAI